MKQFILIAFLISCLFSCKETEEVKEEKVKYDLYQPSEMALHMEYMYQYNAKLRKEILEGKELSVFPESFLKIHTAELTDTFERDGTFESFAQLYIEAERDIFDKDSLVPLEDRYNKMVNLCISCHQTSCTGPIPRIEKLLIP